MSIAPGSPCWLLDGVLNDGLPFVASYMKKAINRPIIITDSIGRIHYPDIPGTPSQLDDLFIKLPSGLDEDKYCYQETDECLYYHIGKNRTSTYIIVKNLSIDMVPHTLSQCTDEIKLAIKYYFAMLDKMRTDLASFKKELAEYLFFKSNANIRDIINLSQKELDIDKPYLVIIVEADESDHEVDWQLISSNTSQHFKRQVIIPISWTNCMLGIFPASFKKDTLEIDPEWTRQILNNSYKFKDIIGNICNTTISIGKGNAYLLADLHKSYNEARFALTLPRLMGKKNFVQQFSDLGVFSHIFSQDIATIRNYCLKTLGQLLEYDSKNDSELLLTLRKLLDNNFNRKSTADSLFIHINTLHYRVDKIEQILGIDLSRMDNRLNLFTVIKVWDTLKTIGFLD